jgi:hypothetical protein
MNSEHQSPAAQGQADKRDDEPLRTPDGRYIIVRDRLWRASNPALTDHARQHLVNQLMDARRTIARARRAKDGDTEQRARAQVDQAKIALGERGPVWWSDGAPDFNRHKIDNTPYADWYDQQVD